MLIPFNFLQDDKILSTLQYKENEFYSVSDLLYLAKDESKILYYIKEQFRFDSQDLDLYHNLLNVKSSDNIMYSKNVDNSKFVFNSEDVVNSKNIHNSSDVGNCEIVVGCDVISDSTQAFLSSFVDKSHKVTSSLTVSSSTNIVCSKFVINSKNIYEGTNVIDSNIIFRSVNVEDCYFCNDCKNVKHCICCSGQTDAEYLVFNKKVDEKMFEIIKKQFTSMMDCLLKFTYGWPVDFTAPEFPIIDRNFVRHYETIPPKFWKWVKTLPNYSDEFMFYLTSLPEFLTK
jgi:hypothetical protein